MLPENVRGRVQSSIHLPLVAAGGYRSVYIPTYIHAWYTSNHKFIAWFAIHFKYLEHLFTQTTIITICTHNSLSDNKNAAVISNADYTKMTSQSHTLIDQWNLILTSISMATD